MLAAKRGALAKLLPGLNKSKAEKKRRSNPIFHDIGHVGRKTGIQVKANINKDNNGFENLDDFFQTSTPQEHQVKSARKVKKPIPPSTLGKPLAVRSSNVQDPTTPYPAKEPKKKLDLSAITPKAPPPAQIREEENDAKEASPAKPVKTPKESVSQRSIVLQSSQASVPSTVRRSARKSASPVVEDEPEPEPVAEDAVPEVSSPATDDVNDASVDADLGQADIDIDFGGSGPLDDDADNDGDKFDFDNGPTDNSMSMDDDDNEIDEDDGEITINLGRRQSFAPAVAAELAQRRKPQPRRRSYFPDELPEDDEEDDGSDGDDTFAIDDSMLETVEEEESETEAIDSSSLAVDKSFVDELRMKNPHPDDEEEDEFDEDGNPIRRSKRRRINTLQYWKNERILLERRRSGGIELKGVVKATATPTAQPKKRASRPSLGTELRKAGFTEKSNPKVIVKVGSKEQPMGIACTSQMIEMVPLEASGEGENVTVGKAFSRSDFASGVIHIPPMTTKPSANTGNNTLVVYVLSGKIQATVNRATFLMTSGCHFFIPKDNQYELANEERKSTAKLVFFQHKGDHSH